MEIALQIYDQNFVPLALFEKDFFDVSWSEFLWGVWSGQFTIPTQSEMLKLVQPGNTIEFIDVSNNDKTLVRWFIRPFTISQDVAIINFNEIKDKLNFEYAKTNGTLSNVLWLQSLTSYVVSANVGNPSLNIEYRFWMSIFSILEEIAKVTDYDWWFDGQTITVGKIWNVRSDVEFYNQWNASCTSSKSIYIDNIEAQFSEKYTKVLAYSNASGSPITTIVWTGNIETAIELNAGDLPTLIEQAKEHLSLWSGRRVVSFSCPGIQEYIAIGDELPVEISGLQDIFNLSTNTRILKKEVTIEECNLTTRFSISEIKLGIKDNYNIFRRIDERLQKLQTRF